MPKKNIMPPSGPDRDASSNPPSDTPETEYYDPDMHYPPEPEDEATSAPAESAYKTLRKGDQGPDVVTLQVALAELGYLTTASDGIYGTGTQTAVKAFQADNGLDSDGIAGRQTQTLLFQKSSVTPIPQVTPGPGDILDLPG